MKRTRYQFIGIEGMDFEPSRCIIDHKTPHGMAYIRHPQGYPMNGKKLLLIDPRKHLIIA